ncbi:MAG: hypothetical protein WCA64_06685 [Gallionella sp.]
MGPGPSVVSPRVLEALPCPTIGRLDPAFVSFMDEMKMLLKFAFQTGNELTMPVSAPGSAGMETSFVNRVGPGDKIIVCQNGVYGGRMQEKVERCGGVAVMVQEEWDRPEQAGQCARPSQCADYARCCAGCSEQTAGCLIPAFTGKQKPVPGGRVFCVVIRHSCRK